jgi:hypothetical protein
MTSEKSNVCRNAVINYFSDLGEPCPETSWGRMFLI